MGTNEVAFFIGLFGSLHCIGMCGPLAFAIPSFHPQWWLMIADKVMYNIGRVITYSFLGLMIGFVGKQLWLSNLQQGVSVVSGLLILIAGFSRLLKIKFENNRFFYPLLTPINKLISKAIQNRSGHFIVGLLNGFLPCGFVYLALVGAVNTPSPLAASAYMFWFGAGTFPLMLIAAVSSGLIGPVVRRKINLFIPYLMVCLGFWFIFRGAGLNIPYLSPASSTSGAVCK